MARRAQVTALEVAQHEAAHVVVGLALGLRLRVSRVQLSRQADRTEHGKTLFDRRFGVIEAFGIMVAAGPAWERIVGNARTWNAWGDKVILRGAGYSEQAITVLTAAADGILRGRPAVHARITRILLERSLRASDVAALIRGEMPED
jgi:hypothetical protein